MWARLGKSLGSDQGTFPGDREACHGNLHMKRNRIQVYVPLKETAPLNEAAVLNDTIYFTNLFWQPKYVILPQSCLSLPTGKVVWDSWHSETMQFKAVFSELHKKDLMACFHKGPCQPFPVNGRKPRELGHSLKSNPLFTDSLCWSPTANMCSPGNMAHTL